MPIIHHIQIHTQHTQEAYHCKGTYKGDLTSIQDYFNGANPIKKEDNLWTNLYVGTDDKINKVKGQVTWWFRNNNALFLPKELQERNAKHILWLHYSHGKIKKEALRNAIIDTTSEHHAQTLNIAIVEASVKDGTVWKRRAKPVRALNLECKKKTRAPRSAKSLQKYMERKLRHSHLG